MKCTILTLAVTTIGLLAGSVLAAQQEPLVYKNGQFQQLQSGDTLDARKMVNVPAAATIGTTRIAQGGTGSSTSTGAVAALQDQASVTGSVARSLAPKFSDVLNFRDFGGKCDGKTDDNAAFTAAFAALSPNIQLVFPAGICLFSSPHTLPASKNVSIAGAGAAQTTLKYIGADTSADLLTVGDGTTPISGWLIRGFTVDSATTMTSGAALRVRRMQNGAQLSDVSAGIFGQASRHLWNGIWLDNVNVLKYTGFNIQVQNEGLMMNGSTANDEGSDIFLDNGVITFSKIGYHVGGGQGGVYFGKVLAYSNRINYQIDNALAARRNREIFFSEQSVSDSSYGYGVWVNDTLTSNAPIVMNGAFGSAGLVGAGGDAGVEIYIQTWPNGRISFGPGQLYNATSDGLKVDDKTVQIAIDPSRFIFNNGRYGINAVAGASISNMSQYTYANKAGNYSPTTALQPIDLTADEYLDFSVGTQRGLWWRAGSKPRWKWSTDGSSETGSNAGSNLILGGYSDAGDYIKAYLRINRASGTVSVDGNLIATNGAMPAYQTNGLAVTTAHSVIGSSTLKGGLITISLSGAAAYSSTASYQCTANDNNGANTVAVRKTSGASFTLSGTNADIVSYICQGN